MVLKKLKYAIIHYCYQDSDKILGSLRESVSVCVNVHPIVIFLYLNIRK